MTNPMAETETKEAHTPGRLFPVWNDHYWEINVAPDRYAQSVGYTSVNAVIGHTCEDAERLARLWAASSDLLRALKDTRAYVEAAHSRERDPEAAGAIREDLDLIDAAISRAEA